MCEAGGTVTGAVAGLYTIDNIMKDLGYDAIFLIGILGFIYNLEFLNDINSLNSL
jgi:hypothetical protein